MIRMLVLSLVLVGVTAKAAESLADKKYWKEQMEYVDRSLKSASETCGVNFTFEWVDKEKLKTAAEKNSGSPNGVVTSIIDEVEGICRNEGDDGKKAVKAKIKGFKAGWADKRSLELKGGIVKYMGNNTEANFSDWAKPWLMKAL